MDDVDLDTLHLGENLDQSFECCRIFLISCVTLIISLNISTPTTCMSMLYRLSLVVVSCFLLVLLGERCNKSKVLAVSESSNESLVFLLLILPLLPLLPLLRFAITLSIIFLHIRLIRTVISSDDSFVHELNSLDDAIIYANRLAICLSIDGTMLCIVSSLSANDKGEHEIDREHKICTHIYKQYASDRSRRPTSQSILTSYCMLECSLYIL